jgi:hypothetical protein
MEIPRREFLKTVAAAVVAPKAQALAQEKPDPRATAAKELKVAEASDATLIKEAYKILKEPLTSETSSSPITDIARLQEIIAQIKKPQEVLAKPYTETGGNLTALIVEKGIITAGQKNEGLKRNNLTTVQAIALLKLIKARLEKLKPLVKLADVRSSLIVKGERGSTPYLEITGNNLLHSARSADLVKFLKKEGEVKLDHKNSYSFKGQRIPRKDMAALSYQRDLWSTNPGVLLHLTSDEVKQFFASFNSK